MLVPAALDDEGAPPTQGVAGADGCAGAGQVLEFGRSFAEDVRAAHAHGHLRVVAQVHEVSGVLYVAAAPARRWRAGDIADGGPDGHGTHDVPDRLGAARTGAGVLEAVTNDRRWRALGWV